MEENKIIRRFNDAPEIRKVDEEKRTVEFVASDGSVIEVTTEAAPAETPTT